MSIEGSSTPQSVRDSSLMSPSASRNALQQQLGICMPGWIFCTFVPLYQLDEFHVAKML